MTTTPAPKDVFSRVWGDFAAETRRHRLEVLHNTGGYLHLRMAAPGTIMWSWELMVWGERAVLVGDITNGHIFSVDHPVGLFSVDVFDDGSPRIQPNYWAGKLPHSDQVKEWSEDNFLAEVREHLSRLVDQHEFNPGTSNDLFNDVVTDAESVADDPGDAMAWLGSSAQFHEEEVGEWLENCQGFTDEFIRSCYAAAIICRAWTAHKNSAAANTSASEEQS